MAADAAPAQPRLIPGYYRCDDCGDLVDRLRKMLSENSAELTPAERFVIERRLLNPPDGSPQTLASIGELFHLSKERVRQIQIEALAQLRRILKRHGVSRDILL